MAKNNIRSIRFSDELAELIDRQVGNTFTEKFENLIIRCVWELPEKEKRIKELDKAIAEKRKQLQEGSQQYSLMITQLRNLENAIKMLERTINRSIESWDKTE